MFYVTHYVTPTLVFVIVDLAEAYNYYNNKTLFSVFHVSAFTFMHLGTSVQPLIMLT